MGGTVPLGSRVVARKLLVDDEEAATVRLIYERYLALGSIPALQGEWRERCIRTRLRQRASGKTFGGGLLTNGPLSHLLRNRMYLGEINHKTKSYPGDHAPLIDPDLFAAVQAKLDANTRRTDAKSGRSGAMLLGRVFDDRGNPMSPSHATKGNVRYCYYVSTALVQGRKAEAGKLARIPAHTIEAVVLKTLRAHGVIVTDDADPGSVELFKHLDLRVDVGERSLQLTWIQKRGNDTPCTRRDAECTTSYASDGTNDADPNESSERQTATIPFAFQTHKRRREILIPDAGGNNIRPIRYSDQQNLVRSIAQARAWLREVIAGTSITTIASREGKSDRAIRMTLSLAFLDPKLVRAALHGTLPRGASARRLVDAPSTWTAQWHVIGLSRPN